MSSVCFDAKTTMICWAVVADAEGMEVDGAPPKKRVHSSKSR